MLRHNLPYPLSNIYYNCIVRHISDALCSYTFSYAAAIVTRLSGSEEMRSEYDHTVFPITRPSATPALSCSSKAAVQKLQFKIGSGRPAPPAFLLL